MIRLKQYCKFNTKNTQIARTQLYLAALLHCFTRLLLSRLAQYGIIIGFIWLSSATVSNAASISSSDTQTISPTPPTLFSVGSGYSNGGYYMLATLMSGLISHPNGALDCGKGGNCGVNGLLLVNFSTPGSVANIEKLRRGELDSAFVQSNIAYWSYTGSGLYAQQKPFTELRALASLYPELLQLVVHADSDIHHITDLAGKRVAVGAKNTGTYINVNEVLKTYNMSSAQFEAIYTDTPQAITQFLAGNIDAIFFVAGIPAPQIQYLNSQSAIRLIPITSTDKDTLLSLNQYYSTATIPANTYLHIDKDINTLAVQALWLVRADTVEEKTAYQLTKALWQTHHAHWLHRMLPNNALSIDHSLDGIGIPLHKGAKRYYDEIGKRF